jgi:drug/metabolite transporter (DMT)-like permease
VDVAKAAMLGVCAYYLSTFLDFVGIQYISTALERMLLQLSPSVVVLIGVLFYGEKWDKRLMIAIATGYAGVAIMVSSEMLEAGAALQSGVAIVGHPLIGVGLVGSATLVYSIYVVGCSGVMARTGSALFTSIAMSAASLAVFVHYIVVRGFVAPTHDSPTLLLGMIMAFFCTVIPSYMMNRAIQILGGKVIGPFNYVGMGLTFIASGVVLDEKFSAIKVGNLMVVIT